MSNDKKDLDTTLKSLKSIRRKLMQISEDELDKMEPASQNEWADNVHKVSVAITRLRTAKLRTLSEKFKKLEPELRKSAHELENDLGQLEDAVQVIQVATEGIKTVTNLICMGIGPGKPGSGT